MTFRFFSIVLLSALWVAPCAAQRHPRTQKAKPQAVQSQAVQPQPEAPAQPAPPPTPEQGPSSPPQVIFQAGQLTIEARNSTMSDVLNAVKKKTGAAVDMPAASNERVVGIFGPGAPRDVMAQLLNGSHYDYVLLGSPANPEALQKIVLMARASGPEPNPPQQPPAQAFQQNLQAVPEVDTDQSATDDNNPEMPAEVQQVPEEQQQPDQAQPDQGQPGQPGQPVVKTPEQLLRELQQQQQQQQQQNAPPQ